MDESRIRTIADMAGVNYEYAYDWIIDPEGKHQQAYHPVSRDEHNDYVTHASDLDIALKIQGNLTDDNWTEATKGL